MYIYYTLRYNVKCNEVVSMLNEWCKFLNLFLCDLYTLCKLSGKKNFMIKILILILLHITSDYLILKFVMKKLLSLRVLKFPSMIKLNFSNGLYSLSIFHIEIYKYFSPRNIFQKSNHLPPFNIPLSNKYLTTKTYEISCLYNLFMFC